MTARLIRCAPLPLPLALALVAALPAHAQVQAADARPVLNDPAVLAQMGREARRLPLLASDRARARAQVDASIRAGVNVPGPRDPGGGATHEQHRRN